MCRNLFRAVLFASPLLLVACGDEGLSDAFDPAEPTGPSATDCGPRSPITVGTTRGYFVGASYKPLAPSGSLDIVNESQKSYYLCTKVTEVRDTATEDYQDAAETVIVAQAKLKGSLNDADVILYFNNVASTDAAVIDNATGALWLNRLTFASRGHGLLGPVSKTFQTHAGPSPPAAGVEPWLYFDVRDSCDWVWGGWEGYHDSDPNDNQVLITQHANFLNNFSGFFIDLYGAWLTATDQIYLSRSGGAAGYSIKVVWRETVTTGGAELRGPALHKLEIRYDAQGVFSQLSEVIIPDRDSGIAATCAGVPDNNSCITTLGCRWNATDARCERAKPVSSDADGCIGDLPCATADITTADFAGAACAF